MLNRSPDAKIFQTKEKKMIFYRFKELKFGHFPLNVSL